MTKKEKELLQWLVHSRVQELEEVANKLRKAKAPIVAYNSTQEALRLAQNVKMEVDVIEVETE